VRGPPAVTGGRLRVRAEPAPFGIGIDGDHAVEIGDRFGRFVRVEVGRAARREQRRICGLLVERCVARAEGVVILRGGERRAIVCGGGKVFTVDAKGCTEWEDNFGHLDSKPGDCGFTADGFRYKTDGMETKLLVDGDVIWSEQLKMTHATKQPDLAAVKKVQGL
jgi:hypothetical protein